MKGSLISSTLRMMEFWSSGVVITLENIKSKITKNIKLLLRFIWHGCWLFDSREVL
jgi:hypothetical protein